MYLTLYSDDINNTITIKDDLSYKVAKLLWNAIAARYEPKSTPVQLEVVSDARGNTLQIKKDPVQVKPDGIKKAGGKKPVGYYKEKYKIPFDSVKEKNQYDFAVKLCKKFDKPYDEAIKLNDGKKKRTSRNNKWQIPFSPVTERSKYDGAYALCRKYKLPYPEAIKRQEEEKNGVILQGAAEKVEQSDEVNQSVQGIDPSNEVKEPVKKEHVPNPAQHKINELVKAKNGQLSTGMKVRHNGPKSSPFFGKEGTITRFGHGDQVLVNFGESSTWLASHIVTVIPEAAL